MEDRLSFSFNIQFVNATKRLAALTEPASLEAFVSKNHLTGRDVTQLLSGIYLV